jgi:hypothetical protein
VFRWDAVNQYEPALGVLDAERRDLTVLGRLVPAGRPLTVGKLDHDEVAAKVPLANIGRVSVHDEPAAMRGERCIDALEIFDSRRSRRDRVDNRRT